MRGFGWFAGLWLALAGAPAAAGVGFQAISVPDPQGPPLEVGVWYPTDAPAGPVRLGLRTEEVAVGAPPAGRRTTRRCRGR